MRKALVSCAAILAMCVSSVAIGEPPPWAGGGKGKGHGKGHAKGHGKGHSQERAVSHFADDHRVIVHDYYGEEFRRGKCPPGLAKKNNGCMPPGQAKKWRLGQPLPSDVVYYSVPPALMTRLPPPPAGHRYVRVAADILLIAIGTGMVVDAIQDLGRMG